MSDSAQEKTEQATQGRLNEASAKGNIAYSKELTAAFLFLVVMGIIQVSGSDITDTLSRVMRRALSLKDYASVTKDGITSIIDFNMDAMAEVLLPLFATVFIVAALGGFLQVGFSMNMKRLELSWGKLNPIAGAKKLLSMRSVFAVVLSIAKLGVTGTVIYVTLKSTIPEARQMAERSTSSIFALFSETVFTIGIRVGILLLVLAVLDFFWQRWRHGKDMMMSKQDVKEEAKRSEGDPAVKNRIRQIQRELSRSRMMNDVKTATVVVRNPIHFAVALSYTKGTEGAPRVVAKGRNHMALRIIAIAEEAGVPVRTSPPLARQLYRTVKVGRVIPEELFQAVAKVLAWVYQQKRGAAARGAAQGAETNA